jgi:hypothetical protein
MNHTRKPKIPSFTAQPLNDDELGLIAAYRALLLDLRPKVRVRPHQPQAAE